jgi:outer membrane usher protein FimD/PapC
MGSRIIIALTIFFASTTVQAQLKKHYTNAEEIEAAVKMVLDTEMTSEDGKLLKFKEKNEVTGTYNFDVTINDKGQIKSVFIVDREGGSEDLQNLLKDQVLKLKMGFKTPKGRRYKVNYKFKF